MQPDPARGPQRSAGPLTENRILLCASPGYLQRNPLPVLPETFARHDWLIYRHPALNRNYWWLRLGEQRLRIEQPAPRLASDNYDFLLAHLLAGQGLQFCPRWSAASYLATGAAAPGVLAGARCLRPLGACALPRPSTQHAQGQGVHRMPGEPFACAWDRLRTLSLGSVTG
ncbi:LysR substrate-binding domain-containing protein [Pseudomonas sp. 2FE]|uniref:LysR substrate-binding domain-containing protein n=1 Tax=Pseudomonas sp. 2FE TaxID=2502190 RepID=UPI001485BF1C